MSKMLVFNAGSTTLKYKLFEIKDRLEPSLIQQGAVEQIGSPYGPKNHKIALSLLFRGFSAKKGSLSKIPDLVAIGHRVVHGGHKYIDPVVITPAVLREVKKYSALAPLHNPPIIEVMEAIIAQSGRGGHRPITNYACFDTAFFCNLPLVSRVYALPFSFYEKLGIRRFGFHGLSHKHALLEAKKNGIIDSEKHNVISIHLGAGSSIAAIKDSQPLDTSMGFTPLEGLVMTTRSGDIDAGIIHWLIETKEIRHRNVDEILNKQSGLLGISEISGDMRDLLYISGLPVADTNYHPPTAYAYLTGKDRQRARLAIDIFVYRIKKYIGAYHAILGTVDAVFFTGAMAERSEVIRKMILENMSHILKNSKIFVAKTDEELEIAKEIINVL